MGIFNSVAMNKPKRNKFDLSHERKMSMKMGKLYPMLVQEVVPGDSFRVKSEVMLRLAPMLAPIMHRVNVYTHFFFVPNRLIWDEWEDFITGGRTGNSEPVFPTIEVNSVNDEHYFKDKSLADYLGCSVLEEGQDANAPYDVSALPFRAYQMIYNEYYRDQNIESEVDFPITSGPQDGTAQAALTVIRNRAWEKDYFTSALPWPQRGGESTLPLTGNAPIEFVVPPLDDRYMQVKTSAGIPDSNMSPYTIRTSAINGEDGVVTRQGNADSPIVFDNSNYLEADLSGVSAVTINNLRKAIKLQEWLEKSARGGSRYIEQIYSHFGVRSSDARLQRPEYLGGGRSPIVISEVLQTAVQEGTPAPEDYSPVGDMYGHGSSISGNHRFKRSFEEHGFVMGIISVMPKSAYQDGLSRFWRKFNKFDYYWPSFAHLGEQEVLNSELWCKYNSIDEPDEVFGYQQRYAEYKYVPSTVHGDFRNQLDYWHMGRKFDSQPNLNKQFIQEDPTSRIFNVTDSEVDTLWVQIYHKVDALRPMPYFSIPSI